MLRSFVVPLLVQLSRLLLRGVEQFSGDRCIHSFLLPTPCHSPLLSLHSVLCTGQLYDDGSEWLKQKEGR